MRTMILLSLVLAFLSPRQAASQDSTTVTTLSPGTLARYRLAGDTVWTEGRIVGVGSCIGVGPMTQDASAGFLVVSMSAVRRLEFRRRSADSTWIVFPEPVLVKLRECEP